MIRIRTALAAVMVTCAIASAAIAADTDPAVVAGGGSANDPRSCQMLRLCSAQTATGVCTSGGNSLVADVFGRGRMTFYATQGTATAFNCSLRSNTEGHTAGAATAATVAPEDGTPFLSESQRLRIVFAPLKKIWIECSSVVGGNLTVDAEVCP